MSTTDHETDRPMRHGDRPPLRASTTTADDGRLQCTLHPPDPDPDEETTRWMTALQGAFVDVETMR